MVLISLKDYAKNNNITYEAVRQQVKRYSNELAGHIIKDGRQQFLDEEAAAFLDSKRDKNPVAIIQQDKDDTIRALEAENKSLLQQIALLQNDLITAKDLQLQLQGELSEQKLLAAKTAEAETALTVAQEKAETAEQIAEMHAQEAEKAKQESEEVKKALEALKSRGFWARVFNKEN